jgi:hypothetical protein
MVRCPQHDSARFLELSGVPQWSATGSFTGYRGTLSDRTEWVQLWHADEFIGY